MWLGKQQVVELSGKPNNSAKIWRSGNKDMRLGQGFSCCVARLAAELGMSPAQGEQTRRT